MVVESVSRPWVPAARDPHAKENEYPTIPPCISIKLSFYFKTRRGFNYRCKVKEASCASMELATALKQKKFSSLEPYFHELEDKDLAEWDASVLIATAEPKDKLLMRVFVKQPGIAKLLSQKRQTEEENSEDSRPDVADFSYLRLAPERLASLNSSSYTMDDVRRILLTRGEKLSRIDISYCSLFFR